jgi:hypothetical protein
MSESKFSKWLWTAFLLLAAAIAYPEPIPRGLFIPILVCASVGAWIVVRSAKR